jgi:replicative DNA helicase
MSGETSGAPRSATEVLAALEVKVGTGEVLRSRPVPLGFPAIDRALGGGLRPGELLLLGGAQGTGKTTLALQMARNVAASGQAAALYVCFEHDEEYLLHRLLAAESVLPHLPETGAGVRLLDVRKEIVSAAAGGPGLAASLITNPRLRPAVERVAGYGPFLFLMRGSPADTVIGELDTLVRGFRAANPEGALVVFIDYLQKVPVLPEPPSEAEKVTRIVNGLKDIALANDVPFVSIVAADKDGLKAARLRHHHLRGSSALDYEADVILILNEKYSIVSKTAIEYNPHQAQRFRDWVVLSVEKNRAGANRVDLELEKLFAWSCFMPDARPVQEKLIEERLYNE